ncbi:MAG TPA: acyl-CoA dehydrogenase C-terminal domain-containing protein [Pseudomonadales bacterium]
MAEFRAALRDMRFLLYDVLDSESHFAKLTDRETVTRDLLDPILDEAARFAETELFPANRVGDVQGCSFEDGVVKTPPGFKDAYRTYVANGWTGMTGDPKYGGQALPHSMSLIVEEPMTTANMAWTMYPDLSHSAMNALERHGTPEQKQTFLTLLLSGRCTGTMCLTEPHAGSDVGILRTKATRNADGTYAITGNKIFISAGEHDLVDNILHLVLARVPDAPSGTKGISLFIVPKFKLRDDGSPGERNGVVCTRIEEKMGIHGNATCALSFDGSTGYLVGEENQGMRCMFTMMNSARLGVGMQGVGVAEAAYQASLAYARERLQMRSLTGPQNPDGPADPIIVHPDVRRMLLTQKSLVEGARALVYYAALQADLSEFGPAAERDDAETMLSFLTPIVKAFVTETSFESVNHAVQIFGGHGFIEETGIEQYVRDCRITLIYEGTTQIQALDLLGRKVMLTQGKALLAFVEEMQRVARECQGPLPEIGAALDRIAAEWSTLSMATGGRAASDLNELGAASVDYLMYSGYATLAYFWARMALTATQLLEKGGADPFFTGKVATARFYMARMLPRAEAHKRAIEAGAGVLMQIDPAAFDHV